MTKLDNSFDNLDKIINKTLKNLREGFSDIPGEDPNITADEHYEEFMSSVENGLSYEFKSNPGFKEFCDGNYDLIDEYAKEEYKPNMDVYKGGEAVDEVVANVLQAFKESDGEYDDMEQRNDMEQAFQSGEYSALEEGKKNKTAINEVKRMQLLAGLITESWLNEEDNAATEEKVQDTVEKAINSSQSQATLQKMADQLSDEDKQRIMKFMSSVNESADGGGEPDLEDVTKKLMSLAENRSDGKHLLGQVIYGAPVAAMGAGLIQGMLAGGGAVGLAAATPLFAAAAAGAVLIGLYKIIKHASSNKEKPTSGGVSGVNIIGSPRVKK